MTSARQPLCEVVIGIGHVVMNSASFGATSGDLVAAAFS